MEGEKPVEARESVSREGTDWNLGSINLSRTRPAQGEKPVSREKRRVKKRTGLQSIGARKGAGFGGG